MTISVCLIWISGARKQFVRYSHLVCAAAWNDSGRPKASDASCYQARPACNHIAIHLTEVEFKDVAADPPSSVSELVHSTAHLQTSARIPKTARKQIKGEKIKRNAEEWDRISARRGHGPLLRHDTLTLLQHSTVCVFQWNKSMYRCFCCKQPFQQFPLLRQHTQDHHTIHQVGKEIISQQNRLVKAEVSCVQCKICQADVQDLHTLRRHLADEHSIKFALQEDLLVPFKIQSDLKCEICLEQFSVFRLLNIHMNKHYRKHICHVCGAGFSNLVFLNLHKTRYHRVLRCQACDVAFTDKKEKRSHDVTAHGAKFQKKLRFPCPHCSERFDQEKLRVLHLVDKHGMLRPEFPCKLCSKVFVTKSLCTNHTKIVHFKSKDQECSVCFKVFFNKYDLSRHRVTHTGEKNFVCTVCSGLFATRDSLRRHLKKSHSGG